VAESNEDNNVMCLPVTVAAPTEPSFLSMNR